MKERPMLMTPENAQKCHDGTKTMTRRIMKPQPDWIEEVKRTANNNGPFFWPIGSLGQQCGAPIPFDQCPYGVVGDRLWVREAFAWPGEEVLIYRGNPGDMDVVRHCMARENGPKIKWTPAIHMPRWACRTMLEITDVRVERLQEISQADVLAEGGPPSHPSFDAVSRELGYPDFSRSWFAQLWESINGPGSWGLNPWVWVISFKKVN